MISLRRALIVFAASRHALAETVIRRAAAGKQKMGMAATAAAVVAVTRRGGSGAKSKLFIRRLFKSSPFRTIASPSGPPAAGLRARLHGGNNLQPPPRLAKQAAPARRTLVFALAAQRDAAFPIFRGGRLLSMLCNPRCQVLLFRWLLKCSREPSVRPKNSTFA